jgi:rhamnosyltransferase
MGKPRSPVPGESGRESDGVLAVLVAFQPEPALFKRSIRAVSQQVERVLVVDNGGASELLAEWHSRPACVELVKMHGNRGVAAAHDAGILRAREHGAWAVLLLDQDSVPEELMVSALSRACRSLMIGGRKVAAVGPRHHEPGSAELSGFPREGFFSFEILKPDRFAPPVACDFLISSGMLIPIASWEAVGGMEESLFIDHVDTEWCLRARAGGYPCFGVGDAIMEHQIGRGRRRFWLGRWRTAPMHPPERCYFLARNSVRLWGRPYMTQAWRRHTLVRLIGLMILHGLDPRGGLGCLRAYFFGIMAGLRGG